MLRLESKLAHFEVRRALAARAPRLVIVRGEAGTHRRILVASALRELADLETAPLQLWFEALPRPDSLQRRSLCAVIEQAGIAVYGDASETVLRDVPYARMLQALEDHADRTRRELIWVIGTAGRMLRPNSDAQRAFAEFWARVRARSLPIRVVLLVDRHAPLPRTVRGEPIEATLIDVDLPTSLQVKRALPSWPALDRLRLVAALGRVPERLRHVDRRTRLATNLQRLVIAPEGVLHWGPLGRLKALQKPERYLGVLTALAEGAEDWGDIRARVPELAGGSTLAPYMATLEEQGWIAADRSLDARPRSRGRRYRIRDPFAGYWLHAIAAQLGRTWLESPSALWRAHGAPALERWTRAVLPMLLRERLLESEAPPLAAPARTTGALWGEGYDVPLAGTLVTGAAFYGDIVCGRRAETDDLTRLEQQVRRTRYGFGRETRLHVLVIDRPAAQELVRRAARSDDVALLALSDLF